MNMSSDPTFITNEQGQHLSHRFGVLLGDNTRFFDCIDSASHDNVSRLVADSLMCLAIALDKAFEKID